MLTRVVIKCLPSVWVAQGKVSIKSLFMLAVSTERSTEKGTVLLTLIEKMHEKEKKMLSNYL